MVNRLHTTDLFTFLKVRLGQEGFGGEPWAPRTKGPCPSTGSCMVNGNFQTRASGDPIHGQCLCSNVNLLPPTGSAHKAGPLSPDPLSWHLMGG